MLDEFMWGDVSRISPEAPVPVVLIKKESFMPGGASNVANNLSSLGSEVYLAGVVGQDDTGAILKGELEQKGINVDGIMTDSSRPTILKTRIVAGHQQVCRIDKEKSGPLSDEMVEKMIGYYNRRLWQRCHKPQALNEDRPHGPQARQNSISRPERRTFQILQGDKCNNPQ
jgi:rfaE bifunctional protein kinase chain/domain